MTEILAAQDTSIGPAGSRKNADVTAWVAVAAGALGAMLATLDISIVNSALPVIQGEIGATGAEGTWIATSFLVAEIVVIPLSAWLERLFGLRTLLIIAVSAFTAFSVLCGIATDLTTMIIGRTGQGLLFPVSCSQSCYFPPVPTDGVRLVHPSTAILATQQTNGV